MPRSLPCLLSLAIAGALSAQNTFTVPTRYASQNGNTADGNLFSGNQSSSHYPCRLQHLYDRTDVPIALATIQGLGYRRPNQFSNACPAGTATLTVKLGTSPNTSLQISNTFANNLNPIVTQVFTGTLNLPNEPYSGPAPAPFTVQIPFSAAFPYNQNQGQALVVDMVVHSFNQAIQDGWIVDAAERIGGDLLDNGPGQPTCQFSGGAWNDTIGWGGGWYPGGGFILGYGNLKPNVSGIGALGTQKRGDTWLGLNLPIDMTPLGAAGCEWNVSIDASIPMSADATGWAWYPFLNFPNDPGIVGMKFYNQGLFLDPAANALGTVATWSTGTSIGTGEYPKGAKLEVFQYSTQTSGSVADAVPIANFRY